MRGEAAMAWSVEEEGDGGERKLPAANADATAAVRRSVRRASGRARSLRGTTSVRACAARMSARVIVSTVSSK
jgi:hypothetical protein